MNTSLELIKARSDMLAQARAFFRARGYLEVDPCALMRGSPLDSNVEPIPAAVAPHQTAYLHTSPEFALKRLLSQGVGNLYFLGHVFRQGEVGPRHNPEFCMAEWYRIGADYREFIEETASFLSLFLGERPLELLSWRSAYRRYLSLDPLSDPLDKAVASYGGDPSWSYSEQLDFLLTTQIEPHLGKQMITALIDFPPHQAALARLTTREGVPVAERFELYAEGLELANGYHELVDAQEQRRRFEEENQRRIQRGAHPLPIDEAFLEALEKGLPDCCGVSVGFDRLMMLRYQKQSIHEVLPFTWYS